MKNENKKNQVAEMMAQVEKECREETKQAQNEYFMFFVNLSTGYKSETQELENCMH